MKKEIVFEDGSKGTIEVKGGFKKAPLQESKETLPPPPAAEPVAVEAEPKKKGK